MKTTTYIELTISNGKTDSHWIDKTDTEERKKGKRFMKRVKERWDTEFPTVAKTAQNLINSAKRFGKEGWGRPAMENGEVATAQIPLLKDQERRHLEWTIEIKVILTFFDNEKIAKGKGFMKRFKAQLDQYYPEYQDASWQKLRDNAARFKKKPESMNLILVREGTRYSKRRLDMRKIYQRRITKQGAISKITILNK